MIPCVTIVWNESRTEFTVVNYDAKPDFLPVSGQSANYETLVKRTPFPCPEYDSRLKRKITTHSISEDFDAEYPQNRMWLETYTFVDTSLGARITAVSETENDANYQVFPLLKQFKYIVLCLHILNRKASGMSIGPLQQDMLDKLDAKALKIWDNHLLAATKTTALEAELLVDLDEGFKIIDPEDEA
jgi:hypothetical protein